MASDAEHLFTYSALFSEVSFICELVIAPFPLAQDCQRHVFLSNTRVLRGLPLELP